MKQNVWQIAAGEQGRYYDNIFLEYNIMFMGPGDFGKFDDIIYSLKVSEKLITNNKKNQVRKFVNGPKEGDIVLLRKGFAVISIGLVASDEYLWDSRFDDVYGWDLQHTRRIAWQTEYESELKKIQKFDISNNKFVEPLFGERIQNSTFTGVFDSKVIEPIKYLFDKLEMYELQSLDFSIPEPLSLDELGEMLFSKGLANDSVDQVISAIKRQRRLGKWYSTSSKENHPTEHEVVAHMILPLMMGLGWSEQLLAVEWKKVDMAGFKSLPRANHNCILICEAKHMWHPLMPALDQAKGYITKLKLTDCKRIMLTDGLRIYLYEKKNDIWEDEPSGYINVNLLRTNHLAPRDTNAIDTFMKLNPQNSF